MKVFFLMGKDNILELNIFEIERFAIHDGPGIRTAVFFQGCNLRCKWCANPESHTIGKHIMFFSKLCTGCGRCANVCEQKAINLKTEVKNENSQTKSHIDRSKCLACGKCASQCLNGALKVSGQKITNDDLFSIILKDKDYYQTSGGGVTLSGGEALLQIEQMQPFLQKCRYENINIALETCGAAALSNVKTALKYVDNFLFDIKTLDNQKFKKFTGGNLKTVEIAFDYLCKNAVEKVTARVPVIPDFNDDEISEIIKFVASKGIKKLHLLPYHTLGMSKYEELGRDYPYHIRESLDPDRLLPYIEIGKKLGLEIKIGG